MSLFFYFSCQKKRLYTFQSLCIIIHEIIMKHTNSNISNIRRLSDGQLYDLREQVEAELTHRGAHAAHAASLPPACRMFTVSEGVRRLDKTQIDALTAAFDAWTEAARDHRTRRSRERVRIVYLVLRYTGARLGEVLSLDEERDIDFASGTVRIPAATDNAEEGVRELPLPEIVLEYIRMWRARPKDERRERLFDLDQGFLRRKFYEQEERCGLSRELLNPRVLRNSRAVELLQGGMPMRAVQALLGHSKMDFTSSYVTLADNDLKHIIQFHCKKEFGMETSARNTFTGKVIRVESTPVLSEVTLKTDAGYEITAIITNQSREKIGLEVGMSASALVKATWVILEKGKVPADSSARNAFPGKVTRLASDGVVVDVQGQLSDGTHVCALLTANSMEKLDIKEGDDFVFMFKAMSVIIS